MELQGNKDKATILLTMRAAALMSHSTRPAPFFLLY